MLGWTGGRADPTSCEWTGNRPDPTADPTAGGRRSRHRRPMAENLADFV
jgi:hypothetical protein